MALACTSCIGSLNPEDEENFNPVTFVNDTPRDVELSLCEDGCDDFYWTVDIRRGERATDVQVSNQSLTTSFLVAMEKRVLGCFVFRFTQPHDEPVVVRVSQAGRCEERKRRR